MPSETVRVLIVHRPVERPFVEMVADHLTRAGFVVIVDVPHRRGAVIDTLAQIGFADRVVVTWCKSTQPMGSMALTAIRAGVHGKLVVIQLDDTPSPFGDAIPTVDFSKFDGEIHSAEIGKLSESLKSDLPRLPSPTSKQEDGLPMIEKRIALDGDKLEQVGAPQPAEPFQIDPAKPPIAGRRSPAITGPGGVTASLAQSARRIPDDEMNSLWLGDGSDESNTFAEDAPELESPDRVAALRTVTPRIMESKGGPIDRTITSTGGAGQREPTLRFARRPSLAGTLSMSVRCPDSVQVDRSFLVQVWFFRFGQTALIRRLARKAERDARDRGTRDLGVPAEVGVRIKATLELDGLSGSDVIQEGVWRGQPLSMQFIVTARPGSNQFFPTVRVWVDGAPVAKHTFKVRAKARRFLPSAPRVGDVRNYRRAFLSYASNDRTKVLLQAQALRAAGIGIFQDVLSLDPGERWERKLYEKIAEADLFLLFWSKVSAASEWVRREAEYAIECQRKSKLKHPEIVPVILDGPPPAPPPPSLAHLHFNDPVRAVIAAYEGNA